MKIAIVVVIVLILLYIFWDVAKESFKKRSKSGDQYNDQFRNMLWRYNKSIELKLKNEYCPLITDKYIYNDYFYRGLPFMKNKIEVSGNLYKIDLTNLRLVFKTMQPDGEATEIIADSSNRYFTFNQFARNDKQVVKFIGSSIWDIVGEKSMLEEKFQSKSKVVRIDFGVPLVDILDDQKLIEFEVKYFGIEMYKIQLLEIEETNELDFTIEKFEKEKTDDSFHWFLVQINNNTRRLKVENSIYYDTNFITQINDILISIESAFRLSLIYHYEDEFSYCLKVSNTNEYGKLKKNNYLICD